MKRSVPEMFVVCVIMAMLVLGCAKENDGQKQTSSSRSKAASAEAPRPDEVTNVTYNGVYENPVRLSDGRYEGEPAVAGGASRPTVVLVDGVYETGNLDGEGSPETAVLLVENSGGSGANVYVAILTRRDGKVVNIGTSLIGDRVQIRSVSVHDAQIFVEVVQHDAADAACCPTEKATRTWSLESAGLVESTPVISGTISIDDLMGLQWVLTAFSPGEPAPETPPLTLHFTEGRVWGNGGCNNYFTDMVETSPGEITLSKIGVTRMACAEADMELESRFIKTLQGATRYSFVAGKLVLNCKVGDTPTTLFFEGHIP